MTREDDVARRQIAAHEKRTSVVYDCSRDLASVTAHLIRSDARHSMLNSNRQTRPLERVTDHVRSGTNYDARCSGFARASRAFSIA